MAKQKMLHQRVSPLSNHLLASLRAKLMRNGIGPSNVQIIERALTKLDKSIKV